MGLLSTHIFQDIRRRFSKKTQFRIEDIQTALQEVRKVFLESDIPLDTILYLEEKIVEAIKKDQQERTISSSEDLFYAKMKEVYLEFLGESVSYETIFGKKKQNIMLVGIQGQGKTTTSVKLALWLKNQFQRQMLLVGVDVYRPAAREQLEILAQKAQLPFFTLPDETDPRVIVKKALKYAEKHKLDGCIFDTAGRLHVDSTLIEELKDLEKLIAPSQTYLVLDTMMGQAGFTITQGFYEHIQIDGGILTKFDSDARGGVAFVFRYITQSPILFVGKGEKIGDIDTFTPIRFLERILGEGDLLSLAEEAEKVLADEDKQMAEKMMEGKFHLEIFLSQIRSMKKMGGLQKIMTMLPKDLIPVQGNIPPHLFSDQLKKMEAIILSMTHEERVHYHILNPSRKRRITQGSGTKLKDLEQLLLQVKKMSKMMKKMKDFMPKK